MAIFPAKRGAPLNPSNLYRSPTFTYYLQPPFGLPFNLTGLRKPSYTYLRGLMQIAAVNVNHNPNKPCIIISHFDQISDVHDMTQKFVASASKRDASDIH
jgi:hypothetical protein